MKSITLKNVTIIFTIFSVYYLFRYYHYYHINIFRYINVSELLLLVVENLSYFALVFVYLFIIFAIINPFALIFGWIFPKQSAVISNKKHTFRFVSLVLYLFFLFIFIVLSIPENTRIYKDRLLFGWIEVLSVVLLIIYESIWEKKFNKEYRLLKKYKFNKKIIRKTTYIRQKSNAYKIHLYCYIVFVLMQCVLFSIILSDRSDRNIYTYYINGKAFKPRGKYIGKTSETTFLLEGDSLIVIKNSLIDSIKFKATNQ